MRLLALKDHPHDFSYNKWPKCPHCGHEYDISRNDGPWELYDDNDRTDVTCPSCDEGYQVQTMCSYSFSTDEQE